jgi:hypothetical protein
MPLNLFKINKKKSPIFIILILFFIFLVPFQLAKILYTHNIYFLSSKTGTQHGYLIQAPFNLKQLCYPRALHGKWLLLYTDSENCSAACKKALHQLQQIHIATGKDQSRVLRVKLSFTSSKLSSQDIPGFLQLHCNKQQFLQLISNLPAKILALSTPAIYLVDPLGNVILHYTLDTKPSDLLKDLKHLLGASQIG